MKQPSTALPSFVAATPQRVKQGETAIPLSERSSLANVEKSANLEGLNSHNTGASHPSAVKSPRKRASGGLPLDPFDISPHIWFGTISVGTPLAFYTVLFDTGLRHVFFTWWIRGGYAIYDPASSSTSVNLGEPSVIYYENSDSAFGQQHADNVMIFGLTSLVQTLVNQGQTDEPVFAFHFAAPEANGHWRVNIVIDGEVMLTNVDSAIDMGSDLTYSLLEIVTTFYEVVGVPFDGVPSVSFTFGGTSFLISAETLIIGAAGPDSIHCIAFWVVGAVFLSNVHTVFDVANGRVGFATLA
ncbi:acid protease [Gyrodon lividus]|nr:acid protease [Gyrodon lividus]